MTGPRSPALRKRPKRPAGSPSLRRAAAPRPRPPARSVLVAWLLVVVACGTSDPGPPVEITVPRGATFQEVTDTLVQRGLVGAPTLFKAYARVRGADTAIRSGSYSLAPGAGWGDILDDLVAGRVVTEELVIPEGFTLADMAPRIADITGSEGDEVLEWLRAEGRDEELRVPGPGLEGYLFPDTYRFARGSALATVVEAMVERYREAWDAENRARLDSLDMSEREVVTLASIIQAEARRAEEMPTISAVYHNRLRIGYPLQADPTVLYALGGRRKRLLFAAIDSVADNPYNTYTHGGLPPGPIGAPGEAALDAALHPSDEDYLYFVARPDGSHIFTRSLQEHNAAVARARREQARARREVERAREDSIPESRTGGGGGEDP